MGMLAHRHMVKAHPEKVEPKPVVEDKAEGKTPTAVKKTKSK